MKYTGEQLRAHYRLLPETLQEILWSEQTAETITRIATSHTLTKEQKGKLASVVGLVILKLITFEQFSHEVAVELDIPPSKARAVALEVEREIFQNIPRLPSGDTPLKGGSGVPQSSPLEGSTRSSPVGERVGGMSPAEKPPLRLADSTPPLMIRAGGVQNPPPFSQPRSVPIRKILPPPPLAPSAFPPKTSSLQTLLADIRRGTAFDEARITEAYRKTPIEIRQSLESIGFLSRLQSVARKFGLNVEETGELVSETGLVLLGLTKPPQFIDNLAKRLRLPRDRAFAVGQAVNMEVLRPVREIIRKMNEPTENTPPRLADSAPLPASPAGGLNQGGDGKQEIGGLRFAPSVSTSPSPSRLNQNPPPTPSFIKEGEKGGGFSPQQYTHDPYREPIE